MILYFSPNFLPDFSRLCFCCYFCAGFQRSRQFPLLATAFPVTSGSGCSAFLVPTTLYPFLLTLFLLLLLLPACIVLSPASASYSGYASVIIVISFIHPSAFPMVHKQHHHILIPAFRTIFLSAAISFYFIHPSGSPKVSQTNQQRLWFSYLFYMSVQFLTDFIQIVDKYQYFRHYLVQLRRNHIPDFQT